MFLIEFLRAILDTVFDITGSYGWSIIVLSLVVTLLMLPLFWIAEMIQSRERRRKLKMLPALEQLKEVSISKKNIFIQKQYIDNINTLPCMLYRVYWDW